MREILREAAWLFSQSETASVGQLKDLGNWRARRRDAWEFALFEGRGAGALRDSSRWRIIPEFCLVIVAIGGSRRLIGEKSPPIAVFLKRE